MLEFKRRPLKFRAWHEKAKQMFTAAEMGADQLALLPDGRGLANIHGSDTRLSTILSEMIPLQFTGLHDSTGHEIYEGDIVFTQEYSIKPYSQKGNGSKRKLGVVKWRVGELRAEAGWCVELLKMPKLDKYRHGQWGDFYDCKVLGNVFENPELLYIAKQPEPVVS